MNINLVKTILKFTVSFVFIFISISSAEELRCKNPSDTNPVREDFNNRINFLCKEYETPVPKVSCEDISGTYSISAVFNSDHCGISNTPSRSFTIYVTQKECVITVSYEDGINPDTGWVDGSTAVFSGTSLIGNITDIHSASVTKTGNSVVGNGTSTLSSPSFDGCIISKSITGTLVE